jgi:hypothetical protein
MGGDPTALGSGAQEMDNDNDEELFTVKAIHAWAEDKSVATKSKKIGEDSDDESSAAAAKIEKIKKQKALKIKADGSSKAMRDAGAKRLMYDEEGNEMEPLKMTSSRIVLDSSGRQIGV